jgi:hypothetical protein
MSRRAATDVQFGSDSFLDVVANLVGILIILIVMAGLRVSQSPVPLPAESTLPPVPAPLERDGEIGDDPPLDPLLASEEGMENVAPPAFVPQPPRELPSENPPREWIAQADELAAEIQRLEQALRVANDQAAGWQRLDAELTEKRERLRRESAAQERRANSLANDRARRRASQEQLQATVARLRREIADEEHKQPRVEPLEHRVTPISKAVDGREQHYRLIGNRVSEVPVASLTLRLRDQIERRKDWLIKQRSSQGQVGPIGGYTMHYVVQRDSLSVVDEVRYGQGVVRISVANWRIEPEPDVETESAEQALQQGSRFYESLIAADEGTTLTFWVYPDSYALYRQLQAFAHEHGFLVAGRPLPHGVPISGSPTGSKSAGQ